MMEMGFTELLLIALVGLLVFGPDSLPQALRSGYRTYLQLSRKFQALKTDFDRQLRSDEIVQSFNKDKEKLAQLDDAVRSSHLEFLDSLNSDKPA